jgi:hypothetical protein
MYTFIFFAEMTLEELLSSQFAIPRKVEQKNQGSFEKKTSLTGLNVFRVKVDVMLSTL